MVSLTNVIDAAARNASSGSKLSGAASQIIAKRVALGVAAMFDPVRADHVEFGRMVPEKVKAFSAATMIMVQQAAHAQEQISLFASEAIKMATRATFTVAGSGSPAAMAETQRRFAATWFEKTASNFMELGVLALDAQKAAMTPFQQTVASNAERLGR